MGILEVGTILEWENNQFALQFVKEKGIDQFIHLYNLHKNRFEPSNSLKWGEEIEFNILEFDDKNSTTFLHNNCEDIHKRLSELECTISNYNNSTDQAGWHFEYGSYMIESVPGFPYNLSLNSIPSIQNSLSYRRWKLDNVLPPSTEGTTMTVFPILGANHFSEIKALNKPSERMAQSVFLDDEIVTGHSRFQYLTRNIYKRRGAKVSILVPVFKDTYTDESPVWKDSVAKDSIDRFELEKKSHSTPNPIKDYIYMDGMGFGMGMSCAQSTYMLSNIDDARYIYDQLAVLSPLWLAMTASTPFFRGMLAATDTRWDAISQSVDCRTEGEVKTIPKSRYGSVSLYISNERPLIDHLEEFNDLDLPINQDAFKKLIDSGIDPILAKHVAYMFIRDPMVIFKESLNENSPLYNSHFENIQSTNWNSVRFKPPPSFTNPKGEIGWRVEFRTSELQISDFENAVFISFITILVKVILKEKLDMYIPISKSDENFKSSSKRNAIVNEKFWFRNDIRNGTNDRSYKLMPLKEIMFSSSKDGSPKGLILICQDYVENEFKNGNCTRESKETILQYFNFIRLRVTGQVETNATFFRNLIAAHPDYKHNSIITPTIAYDICRIASKVGSLSMQIPELYGPFVSQFKPGFESCVDIPSPGLYLSHPSMEALSTIASEELIPTFSNPIGLKRYFFSLCHKIPSCSKILTLLHPQKPESNFARITSFYLKRSPIDTDLTTNLSNLPPADDASSHQQENFIHSLRDYVINEDFTKSWMMRHWLASDQETQTHYADEDESFDSQSETNPTLSKLNSERIGDYFQVVNELSA